MRGLSMLNVFIIILGIILLIGLLYYVIVRFGARSLFLTVGFPCLVYTFDRWNLKWHCRSSVVQPSLPDYDSV